MTEQKSEIARKPVIFSGIQPSGNLTIGNYIGALKNFDQFQNDYDCFYCIVDMHSITVRQEAAKLRKRTLELAALYLSVGLDPDRSTLYIQSQVSAHAELAWILNCYTYMGEMSRMTQFKDKSRKNEENINVGLFTYPVLMAADILLYQTNLVPIGEDQRQHLEITRDIAIRFNNVYSPTFAVPEAYIPKMGARVMSLQEPTAKMSKSDPDPDAFVAILDDEDTVMKKFKRAVTDSETEVRFDVEKKPGISNLMTIYGSMTGKDIPSIENEFSGQGYGVFKEAVGTAAAEGLRPIREKHAALMANPDALESMLEAGAERAEHAARRTLSKVQRKVGFLPRRGSR